MKKILIISHFWPYRGGSKRVIGLAKYLSEFGWEPIILTGSLDKRPDPQFRVIEVPCNDIFGFWRKIFKLFGFNPEKSVSKQVKRKLSIESKKSFIDFLLRFYLMIFAYPDGFENWKPFAIKAVANFSKKEKIDAIISVWPVSSHIIAKELKNNYERSSFAGRKKIPWIADFPDLWSQNHNYSYGFIRKLIDRRLEKRTLLSADALITASWPLIERLKILHKKEKVYAITNGFDPKEVNEPAANLTTKFTITYTGQIYTEKQDPLKILRALKDLISDGVINPDDVEIRFYGSEKNWLEKKIKDYELSNIVKQYGVVPREVSLKKQRESQILLLLNWEDPRVNYGYFGKTFEYFSARRPILSTGGFGSDVLENLLNKTKAGVYASSAKEVKKFLKEFYLEYKQNKKVSYKGNWVEINKYSHRDMARKFANILDEIK